MIKKTKWIVAIEVIWFVKGRSLAPRVAIKRPRYNEKTSKDGKTLLYRPSLGLLLLKGTAKKILIIVIKQRDKSQTVFDESNELESFSFLRSLDSKSTLNFISLIDLKS